MTKQEPDRPRRPGAVGWEGAAFEPLMKRDFESLARFRFGIRRHLRFSEETVRGNGLTPQRDHLMPALKGSPDRQWATVREPADRLQSRRHSVAEPVDRAQEQGLVERGAHPGDGRAVRVSLTPEGERMAWKAHRAPFGPGPAGPIVST
ncbi:MarR family winged helix-turn-helix transcriptional regulator [Streptosporangium sp. CA-135522]|uniref:MarR family winged helix-turn-helix transcriptional regulator n=1 Tax=Streptosporangium sp. CA-135522 TaxID=3240072 RepID=UPI003D94FEE1